MSVFQRTVAKVGASVERHRERHRPSGFGFALADAVGMLNPGHWDELAAGRSVYFSRRYLEVLEAHPPANVRPRYALVYQGAEPVAAVVAQAVFVAASDMPRPGARGLAAKARGSLDKIQARILVCGNLLSWGPHGVAFAPAADAEALWPAVAEALYRLRRADRLFGETDLVLVKDLSEADCALHRFSYRPFETEPDMVLSLDPAWTSFDDYLASLRADYRKAIRKTWKEVAAAGFRLERLDAAGVRAHAGEIYALYRQVHDGQKLRLITMNAGYLPALAEAFGDDFRTAVLRGPEGRLTGFVTTFRDAERVVGYVIGFDKAAAATGAPLYLRLLQAVVEDALALGASRLSLGRTAQEPKARLGCRPEPLCCLVRHRIPALNLVVRGLLNALPEPELAPERNPFK